MIDRCEVLFSCVLIVYTTGIKKMKFERCLIEKTSDSKQ
jgi:hypothetical protein